MKELENITEQDFIECVKEVRNGKITDVAPLAWCRRKFDFI